MWNNAVLSIWGGGSWPGNYASNNHDLRINSPRIGQVWFRLWALNECLWGSGEPLPLKDVSFLDEATLSSCQTGFESHAKCGSDTILYPNLATLRVKSLQKFQQGFTTFCPLLTFSQWGESFSKQTSVAIVIVFLAEMGWIPCCGRPESSSSNIW